MKYLSVIFIFILSVFTRCTVKNPAIGEFASIKISRFSVADTLFLESVPGNSISVLVADPRGQEDVRRVSCFVFSDLSVSVLELKDEGNNGDVIAKDGVFSGLLTKTSFGSLPGGYRIVAVAEDEGGNLSDSLDAHVVVIPGRRNGSPVISDPVAPDTVRTDAAVSVFFSVRIFDPDGAGDIREVLLNFQPSWIPGLVDPVALRDDGTGGDVLAGDGIYSIAADLRSSATSAGTYLARFEARDSKGEKSNPLVVTTTVAGVNNPPVLSDLTAPGTVSRQSSLPMLLSVRVADPQGLVDIKRVYFNTTKPDGTPSSGNPFLMYDDGASGPHGDLTAGDGVYSLEIHITPQNALGLYRFEFFAEDMSGAQAESLVQLITVEDIQ